MTEVEGTDPAGGPGPIDTSHRLDRIESILEIQQLAYRYAQAVDARDLDALLSLFTEDARFRSVRSGEAQGHAALRANWVRVFRAFGPTIHFVGNHVIDFVGTDEARGVVYARAEHEVGDEWIVQVFQYRDVYGRRGGSWLFAEREVLLWYAVDQSSSPAGPGKIRWPGMNAEAPLPSAWPSWNEFYRDASG